MLPDGKTRCPSLAPLLHPPSEYLHHTFEIVHINGAEEKWILRELDTSNNYNIRIETVKFTYKHTIMLLFFENFYKFAIFKYHVMNTNPKTQFLSDFAFPQKIIFIYYVFTILINTIDTTQWVRIDFSNSLWIFLQIEDINVLNSSTEKWIFDFNLNITWI